MTTINECSKRQVLPVIVMIALLTLPLNGCGSSSNGSPLGRGFDGPGVLAVAAVTAPVRVPVMLAEENSAKRRSQTRQKPAKTGENLSRP